MLDKLKAISPVLVLILLLTQGFLIWAVLEAKDQARSANFMALQAANNAGNASARAQNAYAVANQAKTQLLGVSSACASASRASSLIHQTYRIQAYSSTYHEFLLEDLARKAKLDLKTIRSDFQKLARRMGYAKPRGWTWARKAQ